MKVLEHDAHPASEGESPGAPVEDPPAAGSGDAPASGHRHHRRRWPWVLAAVLLVIGIAVVVIVLSTDRAHPVSMSQATQRLGNEGQGVAAGRPARGVYRYTGSGADHLSLPPLSQNHGPIIPGTVTYKGADCWDFRVDFSSHHWQTWHYCRQGGNVLETGGQVWQLWSIGPLRESNVTSIVCNSGTMSLPATASPGQSWHGRCTGTSSAVKGTMVSAGPYRFVGMTTLPIGGHPVRAAEFLRLRTDTGAQKGNERTEVWLDLATGLPLRMRMQVRVVTPTPFGTSTYTQAGSFTLASLTPRT